MFSHDEAHVFVFFSHHHACFLCVSGYVHVYDILWNARHNTIHHEMSCEVRKHVLWCIWQRLYKLEYQCPMLATSISLDFTIKEDGRTTLNL